MGNYSFRSTKEILQTKNKCSPFLWVHSFYLFTCSLYHTLLYTCIIKNTSNIMNNNLYIVVMFILILICIFILFCRWKRKVCSRDIELQVWDKWHHKQRQSCANSLLYGWPLWHELNSRTQHTFINSGSSTQGKEEETIRGRAKFSSSRKAPVFVSSVCGGLGSVK